MSIKHVTCTIIFYEERLCSQISNNRLSQKIRTITFSEKFIRHFDLVKGILSLWSKSDLPPKEWREIWRDVYQYFTANYPQKSRVAPMYENCCVPASTSRDRIYKTVDDKVCCFCRRQSLWNLRLNRTVNN